VKVAAALLAAGASTRFGQPKAFLELDGRPLVRRLADELVAVAAPVVVVVPPRANPFARALDGSGARLVVNAFTARGMGSSLAAATRALRHEDSSVTALLVALADQPLADRELFARLIEAAGDGGFSASDYGDGVIGPPAVLPAAVFDELAALDGERGARPILERERSRVATVPFAGGRLDVDTPGDYERLLAELAGGPSSGR